MCLSTKDRANARELSKNRYGHGDEHWERKKRKEKYRDKNGVRDRGGREEI